MSRSNLSRVVPIGAVAAMLTLLWAPAASAAPALTISLDPPEVMVVPWPTENYGPLTLATLDSETYTPIGVQWGGTFTIQLPPTIDGSAMDVYLGLAETDMDLPTTELWTENSPPDLTVTDLGSGQYSVTLPADNGTDGPVGYLTFDGLTSPVSGVEVLWADYLLELDAAHPAAVTATPDVMAITSVPCALSSPTRCPAYEILPGQQFAVDVPTSSPLRQLGLGSMDEMELYLTPIDSDGYPVGEDIPVPVGAQAAAAQVVASPPPGAPAPAQPGPDAAVAAALTEVTEAPQAVNLSAAGLVVASTPYSATVTVPDSLPPGPYMVGLLEGAASGGVSITTMEMEVQALPRANRGLRSDTGWDDRAPVGSTRSSLVAIGVGLMLIAGLGTGVVLQGRRGE